MKKAFFMAMLVAILAISAPLYADPGGQVVASSQSSFIFDPADVAFLGVAHSIPAPAETSKSIIQLIAGGVAILLAGMLLGVMVAPFMSNLSLVTSPGPKYESTSIGQARKKTKSPVLKMRAAIDRG